MADEVSPEPENCNQFFLDFRRVIDYVEAHRHLIDAHMVDFFTSNHWETLVTPELRKDLLKLSEDELCSLHSIEIEDSRKPEHFGETILDFVRQARRSQLGCFSWVKERREYASGKVRDFISHVMAPKKAYEVETMADVVYTLSRKYVSPKILDLGSGKGYLSQALALQYGLPVVGVDSSDSNTHGAQKRNEKLLKAWRGLQKKSKKNTGYLDKEKEGEPKKFCQGSNHVLENCTSGSFSEQNQVESCSCCGWHFSDASKSCSENCFVCQRSYHSSSQQFGRQGGNCPHTGDLQEDSCHDTLLPDKATSSKCTSHQIDMKGATSTQNAMTRSHTTKRHTENHPNTNDTTSNEPSLQETQLSSFLPVTGFVDKSLMSTGELEKLFSELKWMRHSPTPCSKLCEELILIGLHTCGDLAPTALKLFTSEASVRAICLVGCCYHLLSQQFDGSNTETGQAGFPLSSFLRQHHFSVSRNATMVAQQIPPRSVLHRAILQVILKEKFGLDGRGRNVGKIASKCRNFTEYVRRGLDKLGMQDSQSDITDDDIMMYLQHYEKRLDEIQAFHQLRVAVAPCVETVFLMDRLCFLYEQGFTKSSIVQMFDPVKSPRCYAIIAAKD